MSCGLDWLRKEVRNEVEVDLTRSRQLVAFGLGLRPGTLAGSSRHRSRGSPRSCVVSRSQGFWRALARLERFARKTALAGKRQFSGVFALATLSETATSAD